MATWLACEVTAAAKFRNLTYPPSPASAKQGHAARVLQAYCTIDDAMMSVNKSRPDQTLQVRRIVVSLPLVTTKDVHVACCSLDSHPYRSGVGRFDGE